MTKVLTQRLLRLPNGYTRSTIRHLCFTQDLAKIHLTNTKKLFAKKIAKKWANLLKKQPTKMLKCANFSHITQNSA